MDNWTLYDPWLQTAGGVQREGELLLPADRVHPGAPQQELAVLHRPRPGELSLVDTLCPHLIGPCAGGGREDHCQNPGPRGAEVPQG